MSTLHSHSASSDRLDGVLVIGFSDSDIDVVSEALAMLGLDLVAAPDTPEAVRLVEFNDKLLHLARGSRQQLPEIDPASLVRLLGAHVDEARSLFEEVLVPRQSQDRSPAPWVWGDPALSILAPFWKNALGAQVAAVLVHRPPEEVVPLTLAPEDPEAIASMDLWGNYNRAAMVHVSEWPSAVLNGTTVAKDAAETVELLTKLLESCDFYPSASEVERSVTFLDHPSERHDRAPLSPAAEIQPYRILGRILDELDGVHVGTASWQVSTGLARELAQFYESEYYGQSYDQSGIPYRRDEPAWVALFNSFADQIVATLRPRTVLDAGCAIGLLVEALRAKGVDARGVDHSPWAIDQVPAQLRQYFAVASITDEIDGYYDLITCIEVLEHLPTFSVESAIGNLCRHADAVLFSSTPDEFNDQTHLNVRSGGYWARTFLHHGFMRDPEFDASFIAPQAILFRKRMGDIDDVLEEYESALSNTTERLQRRLAPALADRERFESLFHNTERRRIAENLAAQQYMLEFENHNRELARVAEDSRARLAALMASRPIRYALLARRIYRRLRQLANGAPAAAPAAAPASGPAPGEPSYGLWVERYDTVDDAMRERISGRLAALPSPPMISVILPVYNADVGYLREAIDSVRAQIYTNWELCCADDCSTDQRVMQILDEYADLDSRIKVIRRSTNGHISATSNSALQLATGPWVALLDHDDVLAEHALALAVLALETCPDAGMMYSDEDKLDDSNRRFDPYFKSDFDPLLLLGQNCVSHLSLMRTDLVSEVGGFREGYEGSQDWDLVLRVSERLEPAQIVHIPHVLYHWRAHAGSTAATDTAKPYAKSAGQRAIGDHLARVGQAAEVMPIVVTPGFNRVRWALPDPLPLVSVIIPTRDGSTLARCIDSVLTFTSYPRVEVLVVDNGSQKMDTLSYLRGRQGLVTVIRDERPFNFSALNNAAVKQSAGDVICLLNDDTEITSGTWLDEMVSQLYQPGVGAVGAKLLYEDGRIQHAGIILGILGVAGHPYYGYDRLSLGCFGRLLLAQSMSAVTAACMVVRRAAWDQVGGFEEEHLAVAFNDVDFCLRLREAGWRVVWTPEAELIHHESVSRGSDALREEGFSAEVRYMQERWAGVLRLDPTYNPNLSLLTEHWGTSYAWPPRVPLS